MKRRGFTLIELLVCVAICALLIAILGPAIMGHAPGNDVSGISVESNGPNMIRVYSTFNGYNLDAKLDAKLSEYLAKHPDLEVASQDGSGRDQAGNKYLRVVLKRREGAEKLEH